VYRRWVAAALGVARVRHECLRRLPEPGLHGTVGEGSEWGLCEFGVEPEHQFVQMRRWFCDFFEDQANEVDIV
jgi:hypothetical protein